MNRIYTKRISAKDGEIILSGKKSKTKEEVTIAFKRDHFKGLAFDGVLTVTLLFRPSPRKEIYQEITMSSKTMADLVFYTLISLRNEFIDELNFTDPGIKIHPDAKELFEKKLIEKRAKKREAKIKRERSQLFIEAIQLLRKNFPQMSKAAAVETATVFIEEKFEEMEV